MSSSTSSQAIPDSASTASISERVPSNTSPFDTITLTESPLHIATDEGLSQSHIPSVQSRTTRYHLHSSSIASAPYHCPFNNSNITGSCIIASTVPLNSTQCVSL